MRAAPIHRRSNYAATLTAQPVDCIPHFRLVVKTAVDQITSTIPVADFAPLCRRTPVSLRQRRKAKHLDDQQRPAAHRTLKNRKRRNKSQPSLVHNPEYIARRCFPDEINPRTVPMVGKVATLCRLMREIWIEEPDTIPLPRTLG